MGSAGENRRLEPAEWVLIVSAVLLMAAGLALIALQGLYEYSFQRELLEVQKNQYVARPLGSAIAGLLVLATGALMVMFAAGGAIYRRRPPLPASRSEPGDENATRTATNTGTPAESEAKRAAMTATPQATAASSRT